MDDEAGLAMASELFRLSKATGTRPSALVSSGMGRREALGFDLAVMRAHEAHRRLRWGSVVSQASDGLGAAIQLIYEDL